VGRFGPVGQLGQKGFGHLFKQKFLNSNLNVIFFLNLIQTQNSNNIDKSISYSLMKEIVK
jgi:hypothetical protein